MSTALHYVSDIGRHYVDHSPVKAMTWDRAVSVVASRYGVSEHAVRQSRTKQASFARHHAWWLLRECGFSYPEIGTMVGRDHTSVMAGIKKFRRVTGLV